MNRLRRTLSVRLKKKDAVVRTESLKPQQWLDDEARIKEGCCSFPVKYLGNIEVYESRGMQVCEEAIKALRKSKKKPQKAILYVRGDALRVSDDLSQHLIVDQTIEKVSFCAPDRNHEKGFAYICRDGATRRWMCHAFLAVKDSGERLSHAVGCAFAICLEKKQQRERDALQLAASEQRIKSSRNSSFRPATLAERLIDPQSAISAEAPVSLSDSVVNRNGIMSNSSAGVSPVYAARAIPRPRANPTIVERQGSLRLFPKLQDASPFKRDLSLRLEDLPSNLKRLQIKCDTTIPEESTSHSTNDLSPQQTFTPQSSISQAAGDTLIGFDSPASLQHQPPPLHPVTWDSDPFSAAPFNRATIEQLNNTATSQMETHQHQVSVSTPSGTVSPKVVNNTASPASIRDPPPTTTKQSSPWPETTVTPVHASTANPGPATSSPVYLTRFTSTATPAPAPTISPSNATAGWSSVPCTSSWPVADSSWRTPCPALLLRPEPDPFADPFDVAWADRATAMFYSSSSSPQHRHPFQINHKPTNPFASPASSSS